MTASAVFMTLMSMAAL